MKTIGICFGSTTMQYVELEINEKSKKVVDSKRIIHEGNPQKALLDYLRNLNCNSLKNIAVTGRNFRNNVTLSSISEPEAIEFALKEIYSTAQMPQIVISSGGETQLVYMVDPSGAIGAVHSGNKCASGTGEFFLQQIRRMGLGLEEAVEMAKRGIPHKIAGRCSVFCKSDCTHALNKGELRENIAAGLCLMMADKISDLVKDLKCEKAAIIGGGALNTAMVEILRSRFPILDVPDLADCFEAYGAALWAASNKCVPIPDQIENVIVEKGSSFGFHPPLKNALHLVDFKQSSHGKIAENDECILGLDVGSTTTKAVLMRESDSAILASVYLRTNGDPIAAARNCYKKIEEQVNDTKISILGLGVTGSGRQIAGLHALTSNVINEIIAHATAAAFFDPDVDTIFEIGGQDAKYTLLTSGVPSDYAMNEACSAGTGSFLEESAKESLNVATEAIGDLALLGDNPPNFTDQCSAFISSDIKIAAQEGIHKNDLLAGLVYSICMNYLNRVKGSRPVGNKIFMQGGVCYNKAVPVAMASIMNSTIIVPPDPGLMGAFGVALEVKNRIKLGISEKSGFILKELFDRDATRGDSFICNGGKEKCDRKCEISRIRINNRIYPFGGVCNKYYNMRMNREVDAAKFDLVDLRQRLAFEKYGITYKAGPVDPNKPERTVGILRSFLSHSLFPLYSNFFDQLGLKIILSDHIDSEGISRIEAAFCLPAEITHGSFVNLLKKNPDYLFLPQVMQIPVKNVPTYSRICVFVQGEPYYLKTTFRKELEQSATVVLSPVLKMQKGYEFAEDTMVQMAKKMGYSEKNIRMAYQFACKKQYEFEEELQVIGEKALKELDQNPDTFGIVLFGRPYSAFSTDANMGIPHKIASRAFVVIPYDMLPAAHFDVHHKMFWATGQKIMKAAQFVRDRENLFGFYITNFSCGPDSFLLGYFRNTMDAKPSLTLELDQHTADAGIDTRIEAAIDIMDRYRRLKIQKEPSGFTPAKVFGNNELRVIDSDGEEHLLTDPDIEVVFPSMGKYATETGAAIFRSNGINAKALPIPDKDILLEGRKNTTCKECLPYILTTGSFIDYAKKRTDPSKIILFFMATGGGPCRLGQYWKALEDQIIKNKIKNTAVLTATDENGYAGFGARTILRFWKGLIVADVFGDIASTLRVTAQNPKAAAEELECAWKDVIRYLEGGFSIQFSVLLKTIAARLSSIPLKTNPLSLPVISLIGEIYVRREEFSRKNVVNYLEDHGFMVKVAPVAEYLLYSNYVVNSGLGERVFSFKEQLKMKLTAQVQEWWERRIKSILAESGLYKFELIEIEKTIKSANHLINENFRGEAILTAGLALREILHDSCGIISIGPFGCMPSRVAESILKKEMNMDGKRRVVGFEDANGSFSDIDSLPFLSIETDGSPFPQLIEANLEAFVLQAKRIHKKIQKSHSSHKKTPKNFTIGLFDVMRGNSTNYKKVHKP